MSLDASNRILEKAADGGRINATDALALFECNDLAALGAAAHETRMRKHTGVIVTYAIERNINYSNICAADCDFCGFSARPNGKGRRGTPGVRTAKPYVLTREELDAKIEELVAQGGWQILMQGGLHPSLKLEWYESLLRHIKQKFGIHIHAFSPPEILWFARINRMALEDVIVRLKEAGLDSIPGGGAEILSDRVRKAITRNKCLTQDWLDVMRTAGRLGMRGTATMMFGHVETIAERVEHLQHIRDLQDETRVFTAFIAWPYQKSPALALQCETSGAHDYLKTTAIARLYLDNVDNIQSSWVTQGPKIAQISLFHGCNDMGSTMIEENVVSAAGTVFAMNAAEIERLIRDAGFEPRKRNFCCGLMP
ncbi:MAG: cyclic dehypoxanthinyl futalosine synthase [bacterium]